MRTSSLDLVEPSSCCICPKVSPRSPQFALTLLLYVGYSMLAAQQRFLYAQSHSNIELGASRMSTWAAVWFQLQVQAVPILLL